jgi:hypothetical protein
MIGLVMNEDPLLQFIIPDQFEQAHYDALFAYLRDDRFLKTAVWRQLYNGIDLLDNAQVITEPTTRTFRQVYDELVDRPFANQYIEELLETNNVSAESERIAAHFARQIKPVLQDAGLLNRQVSYSLLLYGYCLYWWQSFARGYAFEVFVMRDLTAAQIEFQMHDVRHWFERYSPADLVVLDMLGDIKTSVYFLQWQAESQLLNDFYISRLFARGHSRTLVVFQKTHAWDKIDGGLTVPGRLETILDLFPSPVQIEVRGIYNIYCDRLRGLEADGSSETIK